MRMARSGGWVLFACLAAPAAAQDAGPFDQLVGLVEPGDDVRVTFSDGRRSRVRVTGLTAGTLSVRDDGRELDLGEADVRSVRYRVRDPIRESFWLGFGSGAACAAVWLLTRPGAESSPSFRAFPVLGGLSGVTGGFIAGFVDQAIEREVTWRRGPGRAWSVAPSLAPDRGGIAVSLSF